MPNRLLAGLLLATLLLAACGGELQGGVELAPPAMRQPPTPPVTATPRPLPTSTPTPQHYARVSPTPLAQLRISLPSLSAPDDESAITLDNAGAVALRAALDGHQEAVSGLVFLAKGALLLSTGEDRAIRLWDTASGAALPVMAPDPAQTGVVSYEYTLPLPEGDLTLQAWSNPYSEGQVYWRDATGRQFRLPFKEGSVAEGRIATSPDGHFTAYASFSFGLQTRVLGIITLFSDALSDPAEAPILHGHVGYVTALAFSPDSATLASSSRGQTFLWNVGTASQTGSLSGTMDFPETLLFSPDGTLLFCLGYYGEVITWELPSGEAVPVLTTERPVYALAFSPADGSLLAGAYADGAVGLWDIRSGEEIAVLEGHTAAVRHLAFSPAGSLLASADEAGAIRLWGLME